MAFFWFALGVEKVNIRGGRADTGLIKIRKRMVRRGSEGGKIVGGSDSSEVLESSNGCGEGKKCGK